MDVDRMRPLVEAPDLLKPLGELNIIKDEFIKHLASKCTGELIVAQTPVERSFLQRGGPDPLDCIYIFKTPGDRNQGIPRHWHYVGSGLTDMLGYSCFSKIHNAYCENSEEYVEKFRPALPEWYPPLTGPVNLLRGFGFELTFRLKCDSDLEWNQKPPAWPMQLMQKLAQYVFESKNALQPGDHLNMNEPLDKTDDMTDTSMIKHILFSLDPQLARANIKHMGSIKFSQIVGACDDELKAAQEWNVRGILEMMRENEETGGQFLVTNMRRGQSIFELNPQYHDFVSREIQLTGSNMAQICASHKPSSREQDWFQEVEQYVRQREEGQDCTNFWTQSRFYNRHIDIEVDENMQEYDANNMDFQPPRSSSRMSQGSESAYKIENAENLNYRYYDRIYLLLSHEAAKSLPIMLHGRLRHSREFSFQSYRGTSLVTFVPEGCAKEFFASPENTFVRKGHWLQIYVSKEMINQMIESIGDDFNRQDTREEPLNLPKNYSWPDYKLYLTVMDEIPY